MRFRSAMESDDGLMAAFADACDGTCIFSLGAADAGGIKISRDY